MATKKTTQKTIKPKKNPPGRPKSDGPIRSGRLSMRTYPDVEAKAKLLGTEGVEAAIMKAKAPAA